MTDPHVDSIVAAFLADPAVQAAADQLHTAAHEHRPIDQAQKEAITTILEVLTRYTIDGLAIPPDMVPRVLASAARQIRAAGP